MVKRDMTFKDAKEILDNCLKCNPGVEYGVVTDGIVYDFYRNIVEDNRSQGISFIQKVNICNATEDDESFIKELKNNEEVLGRSTTLVSDDIENICQSYFDLNPNDFIARQLLLNSMKLMERTRRTITLIDFCRLISNTRESRPMVQKLITLPVSSEEAVENANIAQYFMNDYFNDKSGTFEKLSNFRAFVLVNI